MTVPAPSSRSIHVLARWSPWVLLVIIAVVAVAGHGVMPYSDPNHWLHRAADLAAGEPAPIRFAVPRPGGTEFSDLIRGDVRFDHAQVDDFVILRSDGTPTYHLASTVDDVDFAMSA